MRFIQGILKLTRLYNLLIIALCQCMLAAHIEHISYTTLFTDFRFLLVALSTIMIAAGGNIINDYYDVKIDYINKPTRVVIGKTVSRRWAMLAHAVLSYGAIGIALSISWKLALADTLIVCLLWWYSHTLKCLPLWGNLAVGVLTAMVVLVLPMYFHHYNTNYFAFAFFAFFATVIREFVKDLEDLAGDARFNCGTFPKTYGLRTSLRLLVVLEILFIGSLALAMVHLSSMLQAYVTVFVIAPTLILTVRSYFSRKKEDFSILSFLVKLIIVFGILSASFL